MSSVSLEPLYSFNRALCLSEMQASVSLRQRLFVLPPDVLMILILHINDSLSLVFQRCQASALYSSLDYVSGIYIQYGDYISTPHWIYRSTGKRKETESIEVSSSLFKSLLWGYCNSLFGCYLLLSRSL